MATSDMLQPSMQLTENDKNSGKQIKLEIKHDVSSIFGKKYKPKIIINNPAAAAAAASAAAHQNNNSSEQRPFVCMFCPAAFKNESNLVQHVRVHVNGNAKQLVHSCVYCNRSFKQQTNLEIHMRTYHSFNGKLGWPPVENLQPCTEEDSVRRKKRFDDLQL